MGVPRSAGADTNLETCPRRDQAPTGLGRLAWDSPSGMWGENWPWFLVT